MTGQHRRDSSSTSDPVQGQGREEGLEHKTIIIYNCTDQRWHSNN